MRRMAAHWRWRAVAALGAVVLGAWIALGLRGEARPVPTTAAAPRAVVQALEAAWAAPTAAPQAAPVMPVDAAAPSADTATSVELCGVGRLSADLLTGPAFEATAAALTESAMRLHHGGLALGDDDWGRAIGLRFDMGLRLDVGQAPSEASLAALARLATLATATRDPRVYALAWDVCQHGREVPPHPACASLSARRWAQLDPGNGWPWMEVAGEAVARGEQASVDEAMHQIAVADRFDSGWLAVSAHVLGRLDPELHPVLRLALTQAVFALDSTRSLPSYAMITRHCDEVALRDANRRERCTAIQRLLTERGASAIDVAIGAGLAQRLGAPPEEVERLRAWVHAVGPAVEAMTGPPEAMWSCRAVQGMHDWARAVQQGGEMGAVRRWAAARGETPTSMVERKRAFYRAVQAALPPPEAAASAPKPASAGVP